MKRLLIILGLLFIVAGGISSCTVTAYPTTGYYYRYDRPYRGHYWGWHRGYYSPHRHYRNMHGGGHGHHYGPRGRR